MATTLGLTAVALTAHPDFPGYPSPLTASEVSAGLPAPAAAAALMGQTGAILILVVLFRMFQLPLNIFLLTQFMHSGRCVN